MLNQAPTRRPAWKRLAGRIRRCVYRLATPIDRLVRGTNDPLLPPAHLRIYYYGTWDPHAFARACEIRTELISRGLRPEHRLLDIGCGIGNLAIGLKDYLQGGYDGLDIHPEAIAWCQRTITTGYPGFRFHRADIASRAYNPGGSESAAGYRFPFPDRTFDFIFLASVFTHMMPDAVARYLHEISRLLTPGGTCIESYFLLNDETRPAVEAGRSFMSFGIRDPSNVCLLHDAAVPEAAVAYDEGFVRRLHDKAGLRIHDVRRGRWWNGERHDQDVVTSGVTERG